jgi:hypothetical protein
VRKLPLLFLLTILVSVSARAVQIEDVLRYANGQPAQGKVTISWSTFSVVDTGELIPTGQINLDIVNGVLSVNLAPHNGYLVRYLLSRGAWTSDVWDVPNTTDTLKIADLRPIAPTSGGTWNAMTLPWDSYTLTWDSYQ